MEYDQQNRLERVKIGGITVAQYRYNALGQRTHKITGTGTTTFLYDPSGQLLGETLHDASGQPQSSQFYVWLDDLPLGGIGVTYGANGSVASSEPFFLHVDHLGTPRLATNQAGLEIWRWQSDAFGVGLATGSTTINLRFPDQYHDSESGLHYNYFRDYDPETGRYVESDPIGLSGGLNTYGYAYQNPINNFDPDGRAVWFLGWFLFAGTGATATTSTGVLLTGTALVGSSMLMTGSTPIGGSGTVSAGGGSGDYCLLYPNDPICKQDFNPDQCPGISNKNLKHTGKHLPQFQRLDPAFTLQNQVNLGQRIASNPSNFVGASGGRSAYQANATIGGKVVSVKVVVNSSNNIRTVYIVD